MKAWQKAGSDISNNAQFVIQVADTRQGGWRQVQWLNLSGFRSTEWTQFERDIDLSSDANRVVMTIYVKPNQPAGTTVWVDAIEVIDLSTGVVYHPGRMAGARVSSAPLTVYAADGRRVSVPGLSAERVLAPGLRVTQGATALRVR